MRRDRVVPLGKNWTRLDPDSGEFFRSHALSRRVFLSIKESAAAKACFRPGCANILHDRLVADQRLACPVVADGTEQFMFDRVPLRRSGWIVGYCDDQSRFIRQFLQCHLPQSFARIVGSASVHVQQQSRFRILAPSDHPPPSADCGSDERGCFVGDADHNVAIFTSDVINSYGNSFPGRPARIIVVQHLAMLFPPGVTSVFEIADQFFLFGINADHWQPLAKIQLTHLGDMTELPISVRILNASFLFATSLQGKTKVVQQASDCASCEPNPTMTQSSLQFAERPMSPLQPGNGIASHRVFEQFLQDIQNPGTFFSVHGGPAPNRRIRPDDRKGWRSSRLPRAIVLRSIPVIRSNNEIPPRPCWRARKPVSNRRVRSSEAAMRRFNARCCRATRPLGYCRHLKHPQTWTNRRCLRTFCRLLLDMDLTSHRAACQRSKVTSLLYHRLLK
jgi:hypothetical protein